LVGAGHCFIGPIVRYMMRMTLTNLIVERPAMVFFVRVIVAFCTGARTRKCTDRLFHQCDRHVDHVEHLGGNGPEQKAADPTQAPRAMMMWSTRADGKATDWLSRADVAASVRY
jgi:hypothetical protein